MTDTYLINTLKSIQDLLKGEISFSNSDRALFATDASAYREKPIGIVWPKDYSDLQLIINLAHKHNIPLIPRGAGTSLAGQVVGKGLVVNVSHHMDSILEIDATGKSVVVEPGVVLDELNIALQAEGLFFGPETSTSSRCTIGGMVGNNSCGSHSLVYGSTRDHVLEIHGLLSNGEEIIFKELNESEFRQKLQLQGLEGDIYREINNILQSEENRNEISDQFPDPEIKRRNTGYAIDLLANMLPFENSGPNFNMTKLISGSEGTLMLISKIKLNLVDLPPKHKALVIAHFKTLNESFYANLTALKHKPAAVELIDDKIIELSGRSVAQKNNRFFIEGNPASFLVIEFAEHTKEELDKKCNNVIAELKENKQGYAYPIVSGSDIKKVWEFRKAGLGILGNMKGDRKPVPVIEDTAIAPNKLPAFCIDIQAMLKKYDKESVFYAHIGTGELHLRPILNMKDPKDVDLFREIATDTAHIVKKYNGSLSGEHGDGRLRGEFIPYMIGVKNYELILRVKNIFDPQNIFNPNKIVYTPQMNTSLRYRTEKTGYVYNTVMRWNKTDGMLRAVEKCNGTGDCLKSEIIGGAMCPSYMATKNEKHSTRGRANILREYFTGSVDQDELQLDEVNDVLQLCLSCKACKSECPSGVDISKLKAEFLQYYYSKKGTPLKALLVGNYPIINQLFSTLPWLYNSFVKSKLLSKLIKLSTGFANERSLPTMYSNTLKSWAKSHQQTSSKGKTIYFFADEFTNYLESDIGIKAILLLQKLGYNVIVPKHVHSGRTYLSKGFVKQAQKLANKNIEYLKNLISGDSPIIGLEPSAILTFRDEYPDLVEEKLVNHSKAIAKSTYTFEEFLSREIANGNIKRDSFTLEQKAIKFHTHCYQKALSNAKYTQEVLSFPKNYTAIEIKSGCCGMAGSFGYEKDTYDLSIKVAEMILLPEVRKTKTDTLIAASGTSCRHQIKEGTDRETQHPAEILYDALV